MEKSSFSYAAGQRWAQMSWSSRLYACLSAALLVSVLLGAMALLFGGRPRVPAAAAAPSAGSQSAQVSPDLIPKPKPPEPQKPKDPNAIPESWQEFKASLRKDDQALVALIEKTQWWKNCAAWGVESRKKFPSRKMWALQANLLSSTLINGVDLGGVRGKVPEIGMTTCGAFAVMGLPEDQNRTKTTAGERTQFVWRTPRVYAYTQTTMGDGNALIHSVQY